ncbi:nascent polypeptide-associated complex subunit alpha [Trichomonascus vanleenenianus]|uniref:Egd2p n=1 Tax=Trichomonascus vanleenenianus TaxID=2268995 RepID=UPI003ECB612C
MSAEEAQNPKIEEITEDVEDNEEVTNGAGVAIHNRNEKKARKLIAKLNLKKVEGISRVFFKRARGIVFTITDPEVFRNPSTGTYVVFGEAKIDNSQAALANQLAGLQQQTAAAHIEPSVPKDMVTADLEAAVANASLNESKEEEEPVDDADVDTTGIKEEDLKIVMEQANTSKAKAVAALKKNKGDIVNTIMELTS